MFQGTHIILQKWFAAIALIANAKKGLSSYQLSRDIGLNQRSAWYMMTRIRAEMQSNSNPVLLQGVIEADETYIGGKPRKRNLHTSKSKEETTPNKRVRGTKKSPVLGVVQRGGEVVTQLTSKVTGVAILEFITKGEYVSEDGEVHTNTIEGFWSLLKRAWYGSHHHYKKEYLSLYLAEQCYKYNIAISLISSYVNASLDIIKSSSGLLLSIIYAILFTYLFNNSCTWIPLCCTFLNKTTSDSTAGYCSCLSFSHGTIPPF
jgi:hypothetical protein